MSPEVLGEIADEAGGTFIDGTQDPTMGLAQVRTTIDTLEKRDFESRVHTTRVDRSIFPLGIAFLLFWFGGMALERGRRTRRRTLT